MDTLKILVVDDEMRMRKLVRDFLVRKNYEVIEAAMEDHRVIPNPSVEQILEAQRQSDELIARRFCI